RWMTPAKALLAPADVLVPCALGGALNRETVPLIQAPVIAGAANNQLAEDALDAELSARGVLWAPDFVANAGGIINISVELAPGGYDPKIARVKVRGIADTLGAIYDAGTRGVTPLSAAMELARANLAAA
ncbi:MAG: hypothetical protein M3P44_00950, partial [Actinomycetota bacterium]|nr:hypothetical protein [Actinomycetota bacterium]